MKKVINTNQAPAAIGPYSQAIKVGNLVYTSGQIPINPATGNFVEGGITEQPRNTQYFIAFGRLPHGFLLHVLGQPVA